MTRCMFIGGMAQKIVGYLPSSPQANVSQSVGHLTLKLTTPNLPAAVCLSNRAAVFLKMGQQCREAGRSDGASSFFHKALANVQRQAAICNSVGF